MFPRLVVSLTVLALAAGWCGKFAAGQQLLLDSLAQPETGNVANAAAAIASSEYPILQLRSGGYLPGTLARSQSDTIGWQSPQFTAPFDFELPAINSIHFPTLPTPPKAQGEFCFELGQGDVVFGTLIGLDEQSLEIESPRFGRIRLARSYLQRMLRWDNSSQMVYRGPMGVQEWNQESGPGDWLEDRGQLTTRKSGAALFADLKLPPQAALELEISWGGQPWQSHPDFLIELGTTANPNKITVHPFTFEVWDGKLVAHREVARDADVLVISDIAEGPGRARLRAFLDQPSGRIILYGDAGNRIGEVLVPSRDKSAHTGVRITNLSGNVRIERLQISRWNGTPPPELSPLKSYVETQDGSHREGHVRSFDAAARALVIVGVDGRETKVDLSQLQAATFAQGQQHTATPGVSVVYQDGHRFSGELVSGASDHLVLRQVGGNEPLRMTTDGIQSLLSLATAEHPEGRAEPQGRRAQLEVAGGDVRGVLRDGREEPGKSCLVFQPEGTRAAVPLRPAAAARFVLRERPQTRTGAARQEPQVEAPPPLAAGGFWRRVLGSGNPNLAARAAESRMSLHLRSGDFFPCDEFSAIDEKGLTFKSELVETTWMPHDQIKALIMQRPDKNSSLSEHKRDRLLTLPRMQRDNPPTHLVASRNGDFLRGRVIAMDPANLSMEVRLDTKLVPRDRVASIHWLHPDDVLSDDGNEVTTQAPSDDVDAERTRVQVRRSDGTRLTYFADEMSQEILRGKSDVLGRCQADLILVDEILVGPAIDDAAAQLAIAQWKLALAPDPSTWARRDGSSSEIAEGTESALVGQPAPPFELERLDGTPFRLAEQRGKVLVLDFWATWCGPCIQSMPHVEAAVKEFAEQDVHLYAVNLQETPERIQSTLDRLRLTPQVLLDRSGAVAARYQASAIPQTVIIDREGNIARLFVGGGPEVGRQLREALQEITREPASP